MSPLRWAFKRGLRADLVRAHQAAVADYVGREDRGKPALNAFLCHVGLRWMPQGSIGLTDCLDRACPAPPGWSEQDRSTKLVLIRVSLKPGQRLQGLRAESDKNPRSCIGRMAALGQLETFPASSRMSAPGGKADEIGTKADIARNPFTAAISKISNFGGAASRHGAPWRGAGKPELCLQGTGKGRAHQAGLEFISPSGNRWRPNLDRPRCGTPFWA